MDCNDCRDNLVAHLEGLLSGPQAAEMASHLQDCEDCRHAWESTRSLDQELATQGRAAAKADFTGPVMDRINRYEKNQKQEKPMMNPLRYWIPRLGAALGAVACLVAVLFLAPGLPANAASLFARGAEVVGNLRSLHMTVKVRTLPGDNFAFIQADLPFVPVEIWKTFGSAPKWKIEKPLRTAAMDGQSTILYLKALNQALREPAYSKAFDTDWLERMANVASTLEGELRNAREQGWKTRVAKATGADGKSKLIATVMARSGIPEDDYLKNASLQNADTDRSYRFDTETGKLEEIQVFLVKGGQRTLILETASIEFDPVLGPETFRLDLPPDVLWQTPPESRQATDPKGATMSPEDFARAFFEACAKQDWKKVQFCMGGTVVTPALQGALEGIELVSIRPSFKSQSYPGVFVPYEIKVKGRTKAWNLAVRRDEAVGNWFVDGGF